MRLGTKVSKRDVSKLGILGAHDKASSQKEYFQMLESYLQICFNLEAPLQIFE